MTPIRRKWFASGLVCAFCVLVPLASGDEPEGAPVEIATPIAQPMPDEITVTGTLVASEWVEVSPEIAGTVKAMPFAEGGRVSKGDLLLELDDSLLAAEFRQATASYELAVLRHQRNAKLIERKTISQSVFDESAAELNERKAALEVAQVKLDKTRILAPLDGYVGLRDTSVGAYVTPGQKLFMVVDVTPLRLDFRVPERIASVVEPGSKVSFEINVTGKSQTYDAVVRATQPAITPNSRTLLARAIYPNQQGEILAGSFAKVKVTQGAGEPVLTVPEQALVGTSEGYKLLVVVAGRAEARQVITGVRREGRVAILSGLEEGVPVITAGHQMLAEGAPVNVVLVQE